MSFQRSTDTHSHTPKAKPGSKLDNGKYAFIDHDGNVVSKEYGYAWPYAEGKAVVQLDNDKWAFIDHDGNIIPFKNSENSEVEKKFRLDLNFLFVILNMIQMIQRLRSPLGLLCVGTVTHLGVIVRWTRQVLDFFCGVLYFLTIQKRSA